MLRNPSQVGGKGAQSVGEDPLAGADVDELAQRVVSEADFLLEVELEGHDAVVLQFKRHALELECSNVT